MGERIIDLPPATGEEPTDVAAIIRAFAGSRPNREAVPDPQGPTLQEIITSPPLYKERHKLIEECGITLTHYGSGARSQRLDDKNEIFIDPWIACFAFVSRWRAPQSIMAVAYALTHGRLDEKAGRVGWKSKRRLCGTERTGVTIRLDDWHRTVGATLGHDRPLS